MSTPAISGPTRKGNRPVRRLRVGVLVGAVAASTLVAPGSASAGFSVNVTSPANATVVTTTTVDVSAASNSAFVRFVLDGRTGAFTDTVVVTASAAATTLPVVGLDGATTLEAFECSDATTCGLTGDSIGLTIALTAPTVTNPADKAVVGNTFVGEATTTSEGAIKFTVDGAPKGIDTSAPYSKVLGVSGLVEGSHTLRAVQCDPSGTVCEGPTSNARTFIKDTVGPSWSDVSASPGTVFPYQDHYQDTTKLSARVGENSRGVTVEIRAKGGPIVRTLNLGSQSKGRVSATWNGRKSTGDVVKPGSYTFRFVGADTAGITSKSNERWVNVSDKRLVKKSGSKTVSAKSSFVSDISGSCGRVYSLEYPKSRFDWPKGVGYYSKSQCNGTKKQDVAAAVHKVSIPSGVRYGSVSISTYGAGAYRHSGPAFILYVESSNKYGQKKQLSESLGWHGGGSADLDNYYQHKGIYWTVATLGGNWYDVKEFRVSYSYFILQAP